MAVLAELGRHGGIGSEALVDVVPSPEFTGGHTTEASPRPEQLAPGNPTHQQGRTGALTRRKDFVSGTLVAWNLTASHVLSG